MKPAIATALALSVLTPTAAGAQSGPVWTIDTPRAPLDMAHLVYADPAGGAPELALSCRKGTGQIIASFEAPESLASSRRGEVWVDRIGRPAPWPVSVTVSSSAERTTLRGQANPSAAGGSTVSVEIADRAPVIADWRRTAVLAFSALGANRSPSPPPKSMVGRFVNFCR